MRRGSSVSIVIRLRAGRPEYDSQQRQGFFSLRHLIQIGSEPSQPSIKWVAGEGGLSPGVNRPGREAGHSSLSSAEVNNAWSSISVPPISLHGVGLY
jgi:hypothetical protein